MKVKIIGEHGYEIALLGLGLSHGLTSELTLSALMENDRLLNKIKGIAQRLCAKDGGHNKLLESIAVWIDLTVPRYCWQQVDTYRAGITKQSESTMHTILKRPLTRDDFEGYIYPPIIKRLNYMITQSDFTQIKRELPEAFLQRRIVCTNYMTLRRMILQRQSHKLTEWQIFCEAVREQVAHPELLP